MDIDKLIAELKRVQDMYNDGLIMHGEMMLKAASECIRFVNKNFPGETTPA